MQYCFTDEAHMDDKVESGHYCAGIAHNYQRDDYTAQGIQAHAVKQMLKSTPWNGPEYWCEGNTDDEATTKIYPRR